MAPRGRSIIPLSQSLSSQSRDVGPYASRDVTPSQSRDVAPSQSRLPDRVRDDQQPEADESRHIIPAPRVTWSRSAPKERSIEIRDDDQGYYQVRRYSDEDQRYPERYPPPEDHNYPESYDYRRPPPSRYRVSERWDQDTQAERDVHVNVNVHVENNTEVKASGDSDFPEWLAPFFLIVAFGLAFLLAFLFVSHGT
jgi:hypothetical protein